MACSQINIGPCNGFNISIYSQHRPCAHVHEATTSTNIHLRIQAQESWYLSIHCCVISSSIRSRYSARYRRYQHCQIIPSWPKIPHVSHLSNIATFGNLGSRWNFGMTQLHEKFIKQNLTSVIWRSGGVLFFTNLLADRENLGYISFLVLIFCYQLVYVS